MSRTSVDVDRSELDRAKQITGLKTNSEVIGIALRTLIAVRGQPAAIQRAIGRGPDEASRLADAPDALTVAS